jgi:hypothetical protein
VVDWEDALWTDIDVAISTVQPRRSDALGALLGQLAVQAPQASIRVEVQDPLRDARDRVARVWGRARRPYLVALEDDVILAPDWGRRVLRAIREEPRRCVVWFDKPDRQDGARPIEYPGFFPSGLCTSCPSTWAVRMAELAPRWWADNPNVDSHATDMALGWAANELRYECVTMFPSAVQHRLENDCPSTNGARGDRISQSFKRHYGMDSTPNR